MDKDLLNEPVYQKKFTDREEARKLFWDTANGKSSNNFINYHGTGGIGKSSLLDQLLEELENKKSEFVTIYLDIDENSTPLDLLYSVRNILVQKYGIRFRKFDLALVAYYRKIGKNQNSPEIRSVINSRISVKIKGNAPIVFEPIKLFLDFVANISLKAFASERAAEIIVEFFQNQINKEFVNSLALDLPNTILENLPIYMAEDINAYLEKKNSKMIFFIDTFENLDTTTIGTKSSVNRLKWLYSPSGNGILNRINNCIWVIASREEINSIPNFQSMELNRFDEKYTIEYLNCAGIVDKDLCNSIYKEYTDGFPIMLAACVDSYNINSKEFSEEKLYGSYQEIIERLIGGLDLDSQAIVYFLACLKEWDDNFVFSIAPNCVEGFTSYRYEDIKDLSFIHKKENKYTFDKTIRQMLLHEGLDSTKRMKHILEKTNNAMAKYYENKIKKEDISITDKIIALARYIERAKDIDYIFIKNNIKELGNYYLFEEELNLFETLESKIEDKEIKNDITKNKIHIYYLLGKYNEQEKLAKNYYEETNSFEAKEALGVAYMYNGKFELSYKTLSELASDNNIEVIQSLAAVESRMGKYNEALEHYMYLKNALLEDKKVAREIERNIAKIYSFMGKYEESINILKDLLNIKDESIIDYFKNNIQNITIDDLTIYNDIANTYANSGEFESALNVNNVLKDAYQEYLGIEHPYYLNIQNDIAMIYSHLGNYEEAIKLLEEVYQKREKVLGRENPSTIATLNNLGSVKLYYEKSMGENKNKDLIDSALEDLTKAYNLRKEILGEEHPSTISSLFNIALVQAELGNVAEAKRIAKDVYKHRKEKFGEEHRDTVKAFELLNELNNKE